MRAELLLERVLWGYIIKVIYGLYWGYIGATEKTMDFGWGLAAKENVGELGFSELVPACNFLCRACARKHLKDKSNKASRPAV